MTKPKRAQSKRSLPTAPYETFANALGGRVDSVEVQRVIDALGGAYTVRALQPSAARHDPDTARTVAWDFPSAPPANSWAATHLGVRDDTVVWLTISPALVEGTISNQAVSFRLPDGDKEIFRPVGSDWSWAPAIIRRGEVYLLSLDVGQGHWDGNYKFSLTERQAEALQADPLLCREVWDGLVRICQSGRFLGDPTTLPGDAQALIDARCGRG